LLSTFKEVSSSVGKFWVLLDGVDEFDDEDEEIDEDDEDDEEDDEEEFDETAELKYELVFLAEFVFTEKDGIFLLFNKEDGDDDEDDEEEIESIPAIFS